MLKKYRVTSAELGRLNMKAKRLRWFRRTEICGISAERYS